MCIRDSEIVHYMCQESLINYLDTTVNLPDRIMQRTDIEALIQEGEQAAHYETARKDGTVSYQRRLPKAIEENAHALDEALRTITVCDPAIGSGAFPVGMMTEIVHARMALTPYFADATERTAYHFKRHAIQNSLYGVDIDIGAVEIAKLRLWLSLVVDEENVQQIKPLPNLDYKIVVGNSLIGFPFKSEKLSQIELLKQQFFNEATHERKKRLKAQIEATLMECFLASKRNLGYEVNFDFGILFSEVFHNKQGFDVVIANPPYDEVSEKAKTEYFKANYSDVLSGHYDLYIFFFRRAFTVARIGTTVCYITPHTYLHYSQFQRLRTWLYNKSHIWDVTSRIEGVFESAVVDNAIILLTVGEASPDHTTAFSTKKIDRGALVNLAKKSLTRAEFSDAAFDLNTIENRAFIARLLPGTEQLGNVVDSTQGITVYAKVQGEKIDYFRENSCDKSCKPVTRGREITKYRLDWSGRFIRYGNWLCRSRTPNYFESPKILLRQTADTLIGTFFEEPMYCIDSVHVLISKSNNANYDLKFILGILNSKLGATIYEKLICETGKVFAQVKLTFLRRFPVKIAPRETQLKIVRLVDRILAAKQRDAKADISGLEQEIDQLVYALYGLTPEEIQIAESAAR